MTQRRKSVAASSVDTIFEELGKMTVLELVDLKNKIEEEWGITAAAPVAVAAAGAPAGGGDGAAATAVRPRLRLVRDRCRALSGRCDTDKPVRPS